MIAISIFRNPLKILTLSGKNCAQEIFGIGILLKASYLELFV